MQLNEKVEKWSVDEDDRPWIRPSPGPNPWMIVIGIVVALWLGALGSHYFLEGDLPKIAAPNVAKPGAAVTSRPPVPSVLHVPSVPPIAPTPSLPTLENSDSMARHSLVGLLGGSTFERLVVPDQVIRRIVATVDNLPRPTAPTRVMPLNPVPRSFAVVGAENSITIGAANSERYLPYVRVFEMIDTPALIRAYAEAYPLFQRAYEELGYPGKYFNDRLIETIDDLLLAPEIHRPIKLMRTNALYQFLDPDLETRSAGQKIMVRMGIENESRIKAKLWEIRRELIAATTRHN